MREDRAGERADEQAHSLSLTNACNPYCKLTPLARGNTSRVFPLVFHLTPTPSGLGRASTNLLVGPGTLPGSKRRQLACQVGACCVLTNNFPLSSRWVVSSNLFSPGRCSISGVSSSCPSTAAMTWHSFPRSAAVTTTAAARPATADSTTSSPVAEEQHSGLSRRLPRRRRRRRGNRG
jgi:hypothetical protein